MALRAALKGRDFDVIHVAGHGAFSSASPGDSALMLKGGEFRADESRLAWAAPPYVM